MAPQGPARISNEEVLRIAKLANLDLEGAEVERMARDLGQILGYVEQLREIDVSDVPPMTHVDGAGIVARPDEEAPSVEEGGFRVPAYVDEG